MPESERSLLALVNDALVWVGARDPAHGGGSGVWVSPDTVLTCAHVVPGGIDDTVRIGWRNSYLQGTITAKTPGEGVGGLWPYPDLALVTVTDGDRLGHPCVWLAEEPAAYDTPVLAVGHSGVLQGHLEPATVSGRISGCYSFDGGRLWQFTGNEIPAGMSGGPVLNRRTGAVCGFVTASRADNTDRGGFLVPVEGLRRLPPDRRSTLLRAHDRYHAADRRWTAARGELPATALPPLIGCPISAADEVTLLGLLTDWPRPDDLVRLHAAATPSYRPVGQRLTDLRDVAYELMDCGGYEPTELLPLLRFTEALATTEPHLPRGGALRDWTMAVAARLGQDEALTRLRARPPAAVPAEPDQAIIIAVEREFRRRDRYQLTVWLHRSPHDIVRFYCDEAAIHTYDKARRQVRRQLQEALRELQGNARVEFVVPIDLFDEAFDELVPTKTFTTLGRKYQVVLRDLDRMRDPISRHEWVQRWQRLQQDLACQPHWLRCAPVPTAAELSADLAVQPDIAMLALNRRPGHPPIREALEAALDAGVPVVIWRRTTCPEHDAGNPAGSCTGTRFQDVFTAERASQSHLMLPELVRHLRNRTVKEPEHACRDVALLWDDPTRLPEPVSLLTAPRRRADGTEGTLPNHIPEETVLSHIAEGS